MAPIAPLVSYWLLLVPIRSYWLLLPLYFAKKKLPVHLLRQVTGSAGTAMDVLVTCFSKKGRRVWEEGVQKFSPMGELGVYARHFGFFFLFLIFSKRL